jgi:hypothetical protein
MCDSSRVYEASCSLTCPLTDMKEWSALKRSALCPRDTRVQLVNSEYACDLDCLLIRLFQTVERRDLNCRGRSNLRSSILVLSFSLLTLSPSVVAVAVADIPERSNVVCVGHMPRRWINKEFKRGAASKSSKFAKRFFIPNLPIDPGLYIQARHASGHTDKCSRGVILSHDNAKC